MNIVRIYNMRSWIANGIYKFEQFASDPDLEISLAVDGASTNASETRLSRDSVNSDSVPKVITPSTVVDVNKLTVME